MSKPDEIIRFPISANFLSRGLLSCPWRILERDAG